MSDPTTADLIAEAKSIAADPQSTSNEMISICLRDLATVLVQAGKELAVLKANQPPCDGGCNVNDGPMEECSAHGRPVADVWEIVNEVIRQRDEFEQKLSEQVATIEAVKAQVDALRAMSAEHLVTPDVAAMIDLTVRGLDAILSSSTPTTDAVKLDPEPHVVRQEPPWPAYPNADYMLTQWKCSCGWESPSVRDTRGNPLLEGMKQVAEEHAAKLPEKGEN